MEGSYSRGFTVFEGYRTRYRINLLIVSTENCVYIWLENVAWFGQQQELLMPEY